MTKHILELPEDVYQRLTAAASGTEKSADDLALLAIEELLEELDDIRAAEAVLEAREGGASATYSLQEVSRRLGLED